MILLVKPGFMLTGIRLYAAFVLKAAQPNSFRKKLLKAGEDLSNEPLKNESEAVKIRSVLESIKPRK